MKALPFGWERRIVKDVDLVSVGCDGGQGGYDIRPLAFGDGSAKIVVWSGEWIDVV